MEKFIIGKSTEIIFEKSAYFDNESIEKKHLFHTDKPGVNLIGNKGKFTLLHGNQAQTFIIYLFTMLLQKVNLLNFTLPANASDVLFFNPTYSDKLKKTFYGFSKFDFSRAPKYNDLSKMTKAERLYMLQSILSNYSNSIENLGNNKIALIVLDSIEKFCLADETETNYFLRTLNSFQSFHTFLIFDTDKNKLFEKLYERAETVIHINSIPEPDGTDYDDTEPQPDETE